MNATFWDILGIYPCFGDPQLLQLSTPPVVVAPCPVPSHRFDALSTATGGWLANHVMQGQNCRLSDMAGMLWQSGHSHLFFVSEIVELLIWVLIASSLDMFGNPQA